MTFSEKSTAEQRTKKQSPCSCLTGKQAVAGDPNDAECLFNDDLNTSKSHMYEALLITKLTKLHPALEQY
ncbi:hypothetical protein T10_6846 [Trichinella papuae]|uniref:Uncharacterized protein n=1 Tax=Trichinella papuae TaxID=268474 RepID=A0A0V1N9S5_9BILA|nr:hypothetical protein T10_6846 [Trichinella papuae]